MLKEEEEELDLMETKGPLEIPEEPEVQEFKDPE